MEEGPRAKGSAAPDSVARAGRPSLLQPTRLAHPLAWLDWALLGALYLVAFAFRWLLQDAQPYTAEATHFFVARDLWDSTSNIRYLGPNSAYEDYSWFFWQRPFLSLAFWPAAQVSFDAYRLQHIVVAATVPPLGAWLLLSLGVQRAWAIPAAALLSFHPLLLPWGVLVLPDTTVLALTLGALLAAHHGRAATTAALLLTASWIKEIAFVTTLVLLVLALWRGADGRRPSWKPTRVDRFALWLAPAVPLAFLPLWVSLQVPGGLFPGLRPGGDEGLMLDTLWLLPYLAPLPLLGLAFAPTRRLALVALAWPVFFLTYHYALDRAIESWYNVIPGSLTVLGSAAGLHALARRRPARPTWTLPVGAALGVAALGLLVAQAILPDTSEAKRDVATPWSGLGAWSLGQTLEAERSRGDDLAAAIAVPGPDDRDVWVTQDVDWSLVMYPVSDQARVVAKVYSMTEGVTEDLLRQWADGIENQWDVTLVYHRPDIPANVATRAAYAECSTAVGQYTVIEADRCRGRGGDMWQHYQAAT